MLIAAGLGLCFGSSLPLESCAFILLVISCAVSFSVCVASIQGLLLDRSQYQCDCPQYVRDRHILHCSAQIGASGAGTNDVAEMWEPAQAPW